MFGLDHLIWTLFFGPSAMIIFWIIVILLIVYLLKGKGENKSREDEKSALLILKKRYATGEINKKQFESMKKDILKD